MARRRDDRRDVAGPEAPVGTTVTTRLILQPAWTGVVSALGGGPRARAEAASPCSGRSRDFTKRPDQPARPARAGVGQLADGRVILVAVDGNQPGYSVGLTSFELAQTLARLGAVTRLRGRPPAGRSPSPSTDSCSTARAIPAGSVSSRKRLLIQYYGVYAAPPPLALVNGDPRQGRAVALVQDRAPVEGGRAADRARTMWRGPLETKRAARPRLVRVYLFDVRRRGQTGTGTSPATDDLGRTSTIDRPFRYDTTLRAVSVPRLFPSASDREVQPLATRKRFACA